MNMLYTSVTEVLSAVVPQVTASLADSKTYNSALAVLATLIPYMVVTQAILDYQVHSAEDEEARQGLIEAMAAFVKTIDGEVSRITDTFGKTEVDLTVDLEEVVDQFGDDVFETITEWINAKASSAIH